MPAETAARARSSQLAFLTILPIVTRQAQVTFRFTRCPHSRDDQLAEAVALAWKWFLRLEARDKDVNRFITTFAALAVRAVRSGRRVCGQESAKDVLSGVNRRRGRVRVEPLQTASATPFERLSSPRGQRGLDRFEERLKDNTVTPVPDQAAFRHDFPAWLGRFNDRERQLALALSADETTTAVAARFGVSPARVSQLRRTFKDDWELFTA